MVSKIAVIAVLAVARLLHIVFYATSDACNVHIRGLFKAFHDQILAMILQTAVSAGCLLSLR